MNVVTLIGRLLVNEQKEKDQLMRRHIFDPDFTRTIIHQQKRWDLDSHLKDFMPITIGSDCGMYVIFCLRQWNNTAREEWGGLTIPPLTMEQLNKMRSEVLY
ncbi:uncharacterized protein LOC129313471 [Prosopis cineraria]|uniref:uncharacterized protein LOC129313471 n=1 Tax=Prosopis cineraria TaxID=364024 RepID=UPI00240F42C2|nr:uncharacterized protein LOC129313471 [Prosopis cineraria]